VGLASIRLARGGRGIDIREASVGAAILVTAGAAYLFDSWWAGRITGAGVGSSTWDRRPDALDTAWRSLLRPWFGDARNAYVSMLLVLIAVPLAALLLRAKPAYRLPTLALLTVG